MNCPTFKQQRQQEPKQHLSPSVLSPHPPPPYKSCRTAAQKTNIPRNQPIPTLIKFRKNLPTQCQELVIGDALGDTPPNLCAVKSNYKNDRWSVKKIPRSCSNFGSRSLRVKALNHAYLKTRFLSSYELRLVNHPSNFEFRIANGKASHARDAP
jgi:hypothetical protein